MCRLILIISVLVGLAGSAQALGQDNSCFNYCVQACRVAQPDEKDICLATCLRDTECVYQGGAAPYSDGRVGNLPYSAMPDSSFPTGTLPDSTMPDSTMPDSFLR